MSREHVAYVTLAQMVLRFVEQSRASVRGAWRLSIVRVIAFALEQESLCREEQVIPKIKAVLEDEAMILSTTLA